MKKAIIIGSTSGIGLALGRKLLTEGWQVGFTGRRAESLEEISVRYPGAAFTEKLDVTNSDMLEKVIGTLIDKMEGCDLIVVSSGVGHINSELAIAPELATIDVNVVGFTHVALAATKYFISQGHGHLVVISSIAANRGDSGAPAYGATKAYQSTYAQALRKVTAKSSPSITVTDIQPGFVDTEMAQGDVFWLQSIDKATNQIFMAINRRCRKVYITRRWRFVAWLMRHIPDFMWHKL